MAMPMKMQVIVRPGRFEVGSMPNEERKSAKAGRTMSIDNAIEVDISAANAMNSRSPSMRMGVFTSRCHCGVHDLFELIKKFSHSRNHERERLSHK
jgi:hypothetical protein